MSEHFCDSCGRSLTRAFVLSLASEVIVSNEFKDLLELAFRQDPEKAEYLALKIGYNFESRDEIAELVCRLI